MLLVLRSSRFHSLVVPALDTFSVPVSATSCLTSTPPVLPYLQELLRSLVSTCYNNQFWLCPLVLLSRTVEPPPGIKPKCVAVASLQKGGLESVLPSTCSLSLHHALADPCPCTFSVHHWTSLPHAPLGVCRTVQKGTAVELHVKLCHCHLAAPTLLSGTVTVHSAGRR
jgi:hypothetical protein